MITPNEPDQADNDPAPAPHLAGLPALLSIDETCTVLGVHRNTLQRWRQRNVGPTAHPAGRIWVYREDEVMEWVRHHCHCWHRMRQP